MVSVWKTLGSSSHTYLCQCSHLFLSLAAHLPLNLLSLLVLIVFFWYSTRCLSPFPLIFYCFPLYFPHSSLALNAVVHSALYLWVEEPQGSGGEDVSQGAVWCSAFCGPACSKHTDRHLHALGGTNKDTRPQLYLKHAFSHPQNTQPFRLCT